MQPLFLFYPSGKKSPGKAASAGFLPFSHHVLKNRSVYPKMRPYSVTKNFLTLSIQFPPRQKGKSVIKIA